MKRALTLMLVAGGLVFAGVSETKAQDCFRSARSGYGISLNYSSGYGGGIGVGYNRGYDVGPSFGYSPYRSRSFTRVTPRGYVNRSRYSGYGVPVYGGGFRGGYGGGFGGGYGGCGF